MADWLSVPLGIDIGATRARIAAGERNHDGAVRMRAVASRDVPDDVLAAQTDEGVALLGAVLEDLLLELGTKERRCVLCVGAPDAAMRYVKFPRMSWGERLRAARFETRRWPGFDIEDVKSTVRVHPVEREDGVHAVAAVMTNVLEHRVAIAKSAGLRAIAIDHDACAFLRLFPSADAIIDVGAERSVVHAFSQHGPVASLVELGGNHVTRAIARELSIDMATAERRKRILGCAGAGSQAQDDVIAALAAAVERLRTRVAVETIAVTGNGARLPDFLDDLGRATGTVAHMRVPELLETPAYPPDVVRVATPDWALAAGLLSWSAVA